MPEVTLYTRAGCPLCEKAKQAIRASGVEVDLREVDVDADPQLVQRYGNDVPVIVVDGKEAFRHRVEPEAFAGYMRGAHRTIPLVEESCIPCRGGVPPLRGDDLRALERQLGGGWTVVDDHHLEKSFQFPDFSTALAFTNEVGALAEREGHHPDVHLSWGSVRLTVWTHAVDGLTRSDFVLAAKIDALG